MLHRRNRNAAQYFHVWVERALLHTNLGLWEEAATDYESALEVGWTIEGTESMGVPQLLFYTGRLSAYRATCKQLDSLEDDAFFSRIRSRLVGEVSQDEAKRFAATVESKVNRRRRPPPRDRGRGPGGPPSDGPGPGGPGGNDPGPRASFGGAPAGANSYVLGWAKYRAGQHDAAIEHLSKAASSGWPGQGIEQPLLAMAYHQAGHADEGCVIAVNREPRLAVRQTCSMQRSH